LQENPQFSFDFEAMKEEIETTVQQLESLESQADHINDLEQCYEPNPSEEDLQ